MSPSTLLPDAGILGFIGCGQLGRSLVRGFIEAGVVDPERVVIAARSSAAETAKALGVRSATAIEVAGEADVIILAVKPADAPRLVTGLHFQLGQIVISVVAGVPRSRLQVSPASLLRVMPNTACRVGRGTTALLNSGDELPEGLALARALFEAVGVVFELPDEGLFHAVTALSASGPAFLFTAMDALTDGAVAAGLPRDLARRMVVSTFRGATALAAVPGSMPASLRDEITSPAGTTIRGLQVLEQRAFRGALVEAVVASAERSKELAREAEKS